MDVQAVNRKQVCERPADRHIFNTLHRVCSDVYWEMTAPLTSPIDPPALPLRLTGMSTGREGVCVFVLESFKGDGVLSCGSHFVNV